MPDQRRVAALTLSGLSVLFIVGAPSLFPMSSAEALVGDATLANGSAFASFVGRDGTRRLVLVEPPLVGQPSPLVPIVYDEVSANWSSSRLDDVSPRVEAERRLFIGGMLAPFLIGVAMLIAADGETLQRAALTRWRRSQRTD